MQGVRQYRYELEWIPTADVRMGDRIACLLSDAQAYYSVTGWSDRTIDLTEHNLGVSVHRTFTTLPRVWWAGNDMVTFDLAREALIVKREA